MTRQKSNQDLFATSIAAPVASMIAKFLTHPIDTIKAKIQVNQMKISNVSDIKIGLSSDIIKKVYQTQGIRGFFRGVTISVLGSSIAFSFYMNGYQQTKKYLKRYQFFQKNQFISHFLAGFAAEIVSCALWLPIDVIKQRLQVQSQFNLYKYNGPLDAAKKIKLSEGIIGLYRAYGATIMFFGPFSAIMFASYEKIQDLVVKNRQKPTIVESIICSASASAIAGYITTPLQVVKLRMQVQRADTAYTGGKLQNSIFGYKNIFHGLWLMIKNEGVLSLYKGGFIRICYCIPITTLCISLTQFFKQRVIENHLYQRFA